MSLRGDTSLAKKRRYENKLKQDTQPARTKKLENDVCCSLTMPCEEAKLRSSQGQQWYRAFLEPRQRLRHSHHDAVYCRAQENNHADLHHAQDAVDRGPFDRSTRHAQRKAERDSARVEIR